MARQRSPERDEARRQWLESNGTLTNKQVADSVGVKPEQVRKWKSIDGWAATLEKSKPPRKRGGQPGNKNAAGAGAPQGNKNAETHGAYSTVRLADLPPEQREYIEQITLDTKTNMLTELQLLMAKEVDLANRIQKLENASPEELFVDRVVEMRTPKSRDSLQKQEEKLAALLIEQEQLEWEMNDPEGRPPSPRMQKEWEKLQREIAELTDLTNDHAEALDKSGFRIATQSIMMASAFDRIGKLEAEWNKTHGRIIKLLDSIKGYEMEDRRICLEERKYNLAKQKLSGAFEINPDTGEIIDDVSDLGDSLEI